MRKKSRNSDTVRMCPWKQIRMMRLQGKDCMQLSKARKKQGNNLPRSLQKEADLAVTLILDFWPPEL